VSDRPTISLTPLAACLAVALCWLPVDARPLRAHASVRATSFAFHAAPLGGATLPVTSCLDDNSGGTLREVLATAGEGDTLDLGGLACSAITLANGELSTSLDDIRLLGPGDHELTIDAVTASRVINHTGAGTLGLSHLVLSNGRINTGSGACVYSAGSVNADHVHIAACDNLAYPSNGGGLFAMNSATIADSSITGCYGGLGGGGVYTYSGTLTIERSTISGNSALHAGGAYAGFGAMSIIDSTISGNMANGSGAGGLRALYGLDIVNSTISGNVAVSNGGGVEFGSTATIRNSTIAFNQANLGGGIMGENGSILVLTSSIVALNSAGPYTSDIGNVTTVTGSHDLIMVTNAAVPPDTLTGAPNIGPLADNGGPTQTHALLPGSIAINAGDNSAALPTDQRGFARTSGAATDIGAYEVQPDTIFADGFEQAGTRHLLLAK
jgi:hypothetical protein